MGGTVSDQWLVRSRLMPRDSGGGDGPGWEQALSVVLVVDEDVKV